MLKRIPVFCLFLIFIMFSFLLSAAFPVSNFEISRVGQIHSYADNVFHIRSSESGDLTIHIHDGIVTYRILSQHITAGETDIHWDGCGYNQESLYKKTYTITANLVTESGDTYTSSFNSPVSYPCQYLTYALPSSDQVYLDAPDEWFLEYRTVTDGTVRMDFSAVGNPATYSFAMQSAGAKIMRKDFSYITGNTVIPPGIYAVTVYEISRPDDKRSFSLSLQDNKPAPASVTVSETIMPDRSMSENEIWEIMMRPSVVVDIDFFEHQVVYSEPDTGSSSLGTLHGQTQGVKVIRLIDDWALVGAWNHEEASYIEGWVPMSRLKVENPSTEFGLLIDKQKQTLTVYHRGKVIDTILVSTGKADKNKLFQETAAGCFLTGYHRVNFSMNGNKYDYVIQYDGGNLLHQTPYKWGQEKKDFTLGRGFLGAKASHACIRIQAEPGCGGVNAYWLFTHLPYHTRVIILDDPDERISVASKLSRSEKDVITPDALHLVGFEPDDGNTVRITFGGSVICGGTSSFNQRKESFSSFVSQNGYDAPFEKIKHITSRDDYTCVFLHSLCYPQSYGKQEKAAVPGFSPGSEEIFRDSSIDLIQMMDDKLYTDGDSAIQNTSDVLQHYALCISRNGTCIRVLKGHVFGFSGCSESEYLSDPGLIDRQISTLKNAGCEKIIFLISWGDKNASDHSVVQEAMAHRCVRAGADLIVGDNQGVIQGIDFIEGIPVIYSLGTLLDGSISEKPKTQAGILVQADFVFSGTEQSETVTVIPIMPYGNGSTRKNEYCPAVDLSVSEMYPSIQALWKDSTDYSLNKIRFLVADQS